MLKGCLHQEMGHPVDQLPGVGGCLCASGGRGAWPPAFQRGVLMIPAASPHQVLEAGLGGDEPGALAVPLVILVNGPLPVLALLHRDDEDVLSSKDPLPAGHRPNGGIERVWGCVPPHRHAPCIDDHRVPTCIGLRGLEAVVRRGERP